MAMSACTGFIGDGSGNAPADSGDGGADVSASGVSPGVRRLTRRQYVSTVKALLGVDLLLAKVPAEVVRKGHGQIASEQGVTYDVVDAFYELGLQAAQAAAASVSCAVDDKACTAQWADGFLRRAFRGPLDADTHALYAALLDAPEAGATARERLVTLIATALSSPNFLYRQEIGTGPLPADSAARVLSDYEVATRLSYLVWGREPDDELLSAAGAGRLLDSAERLRQLERLLAAPEASEGLRGFVRDWMGLYSGGIDKKDPEVLSGTLPELATSADQSFDLTVDDVLRKGARSFTALLTVDSYYVDPSVGTVLGITNPPKTMAPVQLDPQKRLGILMHPVVVAAHTKESGASPFPIGKFIYENVLCNEIGPPAVNAKAPPDTIDPMGKTLRQRLEEMTAAPLCQSCHTKIGPSGFAFLTFDPIGRHSPADKLGRPWDTSGSIPVDADTVAFKNAPELSRALARQAGVAHCVARRLFRWAYGRFEASGDATYVASLERAAVDQSASVHDLLAAIVGSQEFTLVRTGAP